MTRKAQSSERTRPTDDHDAEAPTMGRVSRKQSQAETQARLIAVGREHFLRYGLGGARAEKIAEDAGYTRGALYANFDGKEALFLAVIRATVDAELEKMRTVLRSQMDPAQHLQCFRNTFADLVTRSEWIALETEFQANALRSQTLRRAYEESLRGRILAGAELLGELASLPGIHIDMPMEHAALLIGALANGLCVRARLLAEPHRDALRSLALESFDRLLRLEIAPETPAGACAEEVST